MYCPKCGMQNQNDMNFCKGCGAPLHSGPGAAPGIPERGPVQSLLRAQAKAPLFLVGAIALSCMLLFDLMTVLFGGNAFWAGVYRVLNAAGDWGIWDVPYYSVLSMSNGIMKTFALLGQLPLIAIVTGQWLIFAESVDRNRLSMRPTGLTLIKVVRIVQLVLQCLACAGIELILLLVVIQMADYGNSTVGVGIVLILVIAAAYAVGILYQIKLIQTIGTMQKTVTSGLPSDDISGFAAVMCILEGVLALLAPIWKGWSALVVLSSISHAAAAIVFGAFLFDYRAKMQTLMMKRNLPQPPFAPPAEGAPYAGPEIRPQSAPWKTPPIQPDTTVLAPNPPPETTLLAEPPLPALQLVRARDNTATRVDKAHFRIGKDATVADLFIPDNTAVSRQHADILLHDGQAFVVDLNSTNHVYVNNREIPPQVEVPLEDGAELRLGDENFHVVLH